MYLFSHHRGKSLDLCGTNWHWDRLWFLPTVHIINRSYSFSVIITKGPFSVIITKGPFQTASPTLTTFLYICNSVSAHQILTLGHHSSGMTLCSEMDHYHSFTHHTASTYSFSEEKGTICNGVPKSMVINILMPRTLTLTHLRNIGSGRCTTDLFLLTTVISIYPIAAPMESIPAHNKTRVICLQLEGNSLLHIGICLKFLPARCFFLRGPKRWKSLGGRSRL